MWNQRPSEISPLEVDPKGFEQMQRDVTILLLLRGLSYDPTIPNEYRTSNLQINENEKDNYELQLECYDKRELEKEEKSYIYKKKTYCYETDLEDYPHSDPGRLLYLLDKATEIIRFETKIPLNVVKEIKRKS